jgi:predicted RND superfamily exporter protein
MSVGLPILLILVIQGSIWINFTFPTVLHTNIFFMSYLIVTSIQMGANIDYAIVIATRFNELGY